MTETQAAKSAGIAMLALAIIGLICTLVGYLMYQNNLMLNATLSKNKRLECAVTLPNANGIDMNPDTVN